MGRIFGTNGVRGIVGETMTPELALKLGRAVGTWTDGPVLVGRDTRTSGPLMTRAFLAGVLASGAEAVDAGVCPTPAVQYTVKHGDYGCGAIVTASHNPPEFNGIKVVAPDGTELGAELVDEIEDLFFDEERFTHADWSAVGRVGRDPNVNRRYVDGIVELVGGDGVLARQAPRIVVDVANGAACGVAPALLSRLGAQVITLNAQPDGSFPGHPSEPTPTNVATTLRTIPATTADLGVILDGDADRCVFATHEGTYVPGERTLALVAGAKVETEGGGLVVTPVSSSQCVEDHVVEKGGKLLYTAVGSPIVARTMMAEDAVFGGEENGGLIFPEHQHCRDASMTAAWLLTYLAESGQTLAKHLEGVPQYKLVKLKVACPEDKKAALLEGLPDVFTDGRIDTTDGVKVFLDEGWVLVRPSGTEPLVRVFAEAKDPATADALAADAKKRVEDLVGNL